MADKSVGELIAAQSVTPTDLFVLEQNGTAKKLTGQILENWLVSFADGHGGIQSIAKLGTSGLADTYRITLADTTTFDFVVTNGRGINSLRKTGTSGLVDTYTFTYNDGTTGTFTVTNGAKGDKGDAAYIWVKYASQKPTADSSSFGDIPDDWIGIYVGTSETAPTSYSSYKWYQIKGEKGDTGAPATLVSSSITYQVGDSGTIIPSGSWSESIPPVRQGKYLWTREITQFNTGNPITKYSVSRFGIDGTGAVSTVAGVSPDADGNVPLTAADVKALPVTGGTMEGPINMNGQPLSGLNAPTKDDEAATKGYADELKNDTETYVNNAVRTAAPRNLLDNSYFAKPVNQRGATHYSGNVYTIDRWVVWSTDNTGSVNINDDGLAIDVGTSTTTVIEQYFEKGTLNEKKYTLAWLTSDNVLHINNSPVVELETKDRVLIGVNVWTKIIWAALYEGEYTAETLPEYQPKGYGAELAACQRYFVGIIGSYCGFNNFDANSGRVKIITPVPMRFYVIPTLNAPYLSGEVYVIVGDGNALTSGQLTVQQVTNDGIILSYVTEASRKRQPVVLNIDNYIYLSSDL